MSFKRECQHRWYLDYVKGLRSRNYGVHLDFGTAIHAAIERYKTRKDAVPLEEAISLFKEKFQSLWEKNRESYEERDREQDPKFFLSAGERILRDLHSCHELWDAEVVFNEHELKILLERADGLEVSFKGFIDMVVKTKDKRGRTILYVIDFKTCSWGWNREKRQDKDLQAQLFLYKHFLCREFNLDPQDVRTAFVLLKKRPQEGTTAVEFFPVSAGPVSVQRALDSFNSVVTEMAQVVQLGNPKKNRKSCTNDFGQSCPYLDTEHCPSESR